MPQDPLAQFRVNQPNDPLAQFRVSNPSTDDPLAQFRVNATPSTLPEEELPQNTTPPTPGTTEKSWWDWANTSILPDLPEKKFASGEGTHPHIKTARLAEELGRGLYSDIIQPSFSGVGAATAAIAGPIGRGLLKGASTVAPGLTKWAGGILNKSLGGPEAPAFVKKAVESITPKAADEIVSTPKPTLLGDNELAPIDGDDVPDVITKLQAALDEVTPLSKKQREILTAERDLKFKEARNVDITSEDTGNIFMSKLKGQHTKLEMEPLKLDQEDVDQLFGHIGDILKSGQIDVTDSAQTIGALRKLLNGEVLNPSEVKMFRSVFGNELKIPNKLSTREKVLKTVNIAKAIGSMGDIGPLMRQGFQRFGQKEWRSSVLPSVMAYFSEQSKDDWLNAIKAMRNSDYAHKSGLAIYDDIVSAKEEFAVDSLVKNLPLVKHGNRATVVGLSKMRMELFNTLYDDYDRLAKAAMKNAGSDPELMEAAKLYDPSNPYMGRKIANMVNVSTGRGKVGFLEPIVEELNATLWSPRLMSARIQSIHNVLNPASYIKKDPVERKDALRQLISMVGAATTTASMLKMAGFEIGTDPRSSDFLKGKIGKTRFDLMGGYPSYFVPVARMLTGETVSTDDKEVTPLNSKFGGPTYWSVGENFITNKEAPLAALITALMKGREATGQDINLESNNPMENTIIKQFMPFMAQDFYELYQEDPSLLPLMGGVFIGGNVAVHNNEKDSRFTGRR